MLEDTYGHSPIKKMFDLGDVYGVGYDEERASKKPLKLGIIGAGGVALSKHIPAIMRLRTIWEPVELVAISRRDERVGRQIESMYGCRWYADYKDMLANEEMDGVLILGPDALHAEHSIACMEKSLPVLVEKPITRSLVDSMMMCKYADEHNVPLMTVSNKRYSPPYRRAKRFVDEGPVSNPAMYAGKFNLGYDYVEIFEQGTIHLFDLTRYFMGDVKSVYAVGVNKYRRNKCPYPIDNAMISLEFTSGSVGQLYTSSSAVSLKPWERIEIYAEKSWLSVEDQYELRLYDSEEGPAKSWKPVVPNTLLFDEEFGGFMGLIENFLQVIRGEEKPIVTGWDGHKAYELDVASHLSLSRGEAVALPLDPASADDECREWLRSRSVAREG
ncbi:MAG: Gfo/Idh/MocA family protein [Armatimonadota bacterium]